MQILLRCKYCQHMTVSDKDEDVCLEIDAYEKEIKFVCRSCKKENRLNIDLTHNSKLQSLPRISTSRH